MILKLFGKRLRRSALAIGACVALFTGIFLARAIDFPVSAYLLWLVLPFLVVSIRRHNAFTLLCLVVLFLGMGWWRGSAYMQKLAVHENFHQEHVTVVGIATEEAVYGKRYQLEFVLSNVHVAHPEQTPLVGSLTVRGFGEAAVYRGDTVQVTGKLYPTLGNSLGSISFAELTVLKRGTSWIDEFRRRFAAGMQSALPEPVASFALGLLIGQRTTLPEHTSEQLRHAGLTHIIAVSGYNLTIIVVACRRMLAKSSKFQATASCLTLIGLFLLITGSSPPIVRASIISVLSIAAWYYGRTIKPLVLLLVGAAITVLANPLYLWGNVSWYLSFLAFYGVLVLGPLVTKRFFGEKEPRLLVGILIETICASVMVLPYILFVFGEMSMVGIVANVLVVPLVPLAMVLGLLAGLGGMLLPALAGWLSWPANLLLTYMLDVANILSRIKHAYIEDIGFSWQAMAAAYGTIEFVMLVLLCKSRTPATAKALPEICKNSINRPT